MIHREYLNPRFDSEGGRLSVQRRTQPHLMPSGEVSSMATHCPLSQHCGNVASVKYRRLLARRGATTKAAHRIAPYEEGQVALRLLVRGFQGCERTSINQRASANLATRRFARVSAPIARSRKAFCRITLCQRVVVVC